MGRIIVEEKIHKIAEIRAIAGTMKQQDIAKKLHCSIRLIQEAIKGTVYVKKRNIMKIPIKLLRAAKIPAKGHPTDAGRDASVSCFLIPVLLDKKEQFIKINEIDKQKLYRQELKALGDVQSDIINQGNDSYMIHSLDRVGCGLGFATAIPTGYYMSGVPRSGLASWAGLTIINSPCTIDAGYRNEWIAVIVNLSRDPHVIKVGERICQIMLHKINDFEWEEVDELPPSQDRGMDGFGSTGR